MPPLSDADKAGIRQGLKDGFTIESLVWIYQTTTPKVEEAIREGQEAPAPNPVD